MVAVIKSSISIIHLLMNVTWFIHKVWAKCTTLFVARNVPPPIVIGQNSHQYVYDKHLVVFE